MSGNEVGTRKGVSGIATIGRATRSELVLSDAGISWRHARIEDRGDAWWALVDLGSTNGSVVNGEKRAETLLAHGDKVVLGRTVLRFELQDRLEQAYDEQLQRLLHVDDLSGLYVRRRFDRELARLVEEQSRARARQRGPARDGHGRHQGHQRPPRPPLRRVHHRRDGRLIGRVVGDRGIGSRFGGDEFCAALPGLDTAAAGARREEIHAAVGEHPYVARGRRAAARHLHRRGGVPADARDAEALFQRADEALYRAKQGGKNRVCV
jgi:two-component system cell cycle response regulator